MRLFIGTLVKSNRIRKALTQQELANKLKVDRQYIWKIENGKVNITIDYLEKIIHGMNSSYVDFFKTNDK